MESCSCFHLRVHSTSANQTPATAAEHPENEERAAAAAIDNTTIAVMFPLLKEI